VSPHTKVRALTTLSAILGVALGIVVSLKACSVCVVVERPGVETASVDPLDAAIHTLIEAHR
jgi:hypothetical protein